MTNYPKLCEECGIFLCFVREAGPEEKDLCYPCYKFRYLKEYGDAVNWLEFRRAGGSDGSVENWYRWNEADRSDNKVPEQV